MYGDLHGLVADFARIGATEAGGVCRLTGSPEDGQARKLFAEEAARRGAEVLTDPVGNMFATFRLSPEADSTVLVGSHLDSQPTGGRYDGAYGVLAGLVAATQIARRVATGEEAKPRHNLTVVNWTNEEGARFQPSLTGSLVYVGALPLDMALAIEDGKGIALGAALEAIGYLGRTAFALRPVRYIELHIEQGERLEAAGLDIGLVHDTWSARKLTIRFIGETSHTGPTAMAKRRDALRAAAGAITRLYDLVEAQDCGIHASAARMRIHPDSPNVVPSEVTVWFEIRHPDIAVATAVGDRFLSETKRDLTSRNIAIRIVSDEKRANIALDGQGVEIVRRAALAAGKTVLDMQTVAGHDALSLQKKVPSSLVFVPSADGISHNEREYTSPIDLENGLDVLTGALWEMIAGN